MLENVVAQLDLKSDRCWMYVRSGCNILGQELDDLDPAGLDTGLEIRIIWNDKLEAQ